MPARIAALISDRATLAKRRTKTRTSSWMMTQARDHHADGDRADRLVKSFPRLASTKWAALSGGRGGCTMVSHVVSHANWRWVVYACLLDAIKL